MRWFPLTDCLPKVNPRAQDFWDARLNYRTIRRDADHTPCGLSHVGSVQCKTSVISGLSPLVDAASAGPAAKWDLLFGVRRGSPRSVRQCGGAGFHVTQKKNLA